METESRLKNWTLESKALSPQIWEVMMTHTSQAVISKKGKDLEVLIDLVAKAALEFEATLNEKSP